MTHRLRRIDDLDSGDDGKMMDYLSIIAALYKVFTPLLLANQALTACPPQRTLELMLPLQTGRILGASRFEGRTTTVRHARRRSHPAARPDLDHARAACS